MPGWQRTRSGATARREGTQVSWHQQVPLVQVRPLSQLPSTFQGPQSQEHRQAM